ncbi:hypothetical protein O3M35_011221 [Rhynocoris fuscipes]|uniref:Large ribosomal subunit protein uL30m n=1 Tax=Rhynocoris fuscipes TaxID=488301 RepID=A0AAW1CVS3_9HEMI
MLPVCNSNSFLCSRIISQLFIRNGLKCWTGGIQYPGFVYYPRHPDKHEDPPYEPTKLLMIQRVKPFKGNAYWLKRILKELKLDGKRSDIAIVKNIPENNARLYKIKHLIKITPIKTPKGISDDCTMGYLREDGVYLSGKTLAANDDRLRITEDFQTDPARLDADTLIKQSRDKWNNPW